MQTVRANHWQNRATDEHEGQGLVAQCPVCRTLATNLLPTPTALGCVELACAGCGFDDEVQLEGFTEQDEQRAKGHAVTAPDPTPEPIIENLSAPGYHEDAPE